MTVSGDRNMELKVSEHLEAITPHDQRDIGQQVERILRHPLFRQSKRLPLFLQFIVNESFDHTSGSPPKERTVGIEVFGRRPDYDTNSDPIVRVTATELRKKLAQYYYEDGHNDEIRIELPSGSYLPKFRRSARAHFSETEAAAVESGTAVEAENAEEEITAATETHAVAAEVPATPGLEAHAATPQWRTVAITLGAGVVLLAATAAVKLWPASSPLGEFWKQFAGSANEVILVTPSIGSVTNRPATEPDNAISVAPKLSLEDTNIIARVAGQLEKRDVRYRLVSSSDATFEELRSGPAVFIGALDNVWTMRFSKDLPFAFGKTPDGHTGQIVETGTARSWNLDIYTPHAHITRDYGVVARYRNRLTGEPVVLIAGISSQGTQAAGELLTSNHLIESIPADLTKAANFELVVETEAIDGHAGPPHIVASKTW